MNLLIVIGGVIAFLFAVSFLGSMVWLAALWLWNAAGDILASSDISNSELILIVIVTAVTSLVFIDGIDRWGWNKPSQYMIDRDIKPLPADNYLKAIGIILFICWCFIGGGVLFTISIVIITITISLESIRMLKARQKKLQERRELYRRIGLEYQKKSFSKLGGI